MVELKIIQIGDSLGVILLTDVLARLKLGKGDTVLLTDKVNGLNLSAYSPDVDEQLKTGREFMHDYRDTFHQLAK